MTADDQSLPLPSGVSTDTSQPDQLPVDKPRLSTFEDLRSISEDHGLLTLGVLTLAGSCFGPVSPIDRFVAESGHFCNVLTLEFETPLLDGFQHLGDASWNSRLQALPRPLFDEFIAWLGTLAFLDSPARQLYRVRLAKLLAYDPRYGQVLAGVPLTAAGLDTTIGCVGFIQCALPTVVMTSHVFDDTAKMRDAIFAGSSDPYKEASRELRG